MNLKAKPLELEAQKPIVILNKEDAGELDVRPLDRVELSYKGRKITGIVNVAQRFVRQGEIGLYSAVEQELKVVPGDNVKVEPSNPPESLAFIQERLSGKRLKPPEIRKIVEDVIANKLSDIEITAFVTSLYSHKMTVEETVALSSTMTSTGKTLKLTKKEIYDKHSLGGVPGDKTTMVLVPIVAAAGLTIPKTSSRAITSPAGTADRVECLCPVELSMEEIRRVVKKTNGCMVWGGAVDLAPADDIFIQIEYPLSIDPLLLPSVMSKKKAAGAKYLVIDIPTGKGTKIKTIGDADELAGKFIELGGKMGIKVNCISTFGEQPVGYAIGPALEAREALSTVMGRGPPDLVDKALDLSAALFSFKGRGDQFKKARSILKSGKAYRKLKEIIEAQGGNPRIRPEDIPIGSRSAEVRAGSSGKILWVNNHDFVAIAKAAGAPKNKGSGILLHKKLGDKVKKGDVLFEIFAEKRYKLQRALQLARTLDIVGIGDKFEMTLSRFPEKKHHRHFILER